MTSSYSIPGLTPGQQQIVELALRMARSELHDGLSRVIGTALFAATAGPLYHTQDVVAAATTALASYSGIWFPDGLFQTGGSLDAAVSHVMATSAGLSGSGALQAVTV